MAHAISMRNPSNGLIRNGFIGFSWTYLFFGFLVPLFRGELLIAVLHALCTAITAGIWQFVFCFFYNKQYTTRMIEQGFKFADSPYLNEKAARAIGVDLSGHLAQTSPP